MLYVIIYVVRSTDVGWNPPSVNTGLINKYILRAYDQQREDLVVESVFFGSTTLTGGH